MKEEERQPKTKEELDALKKEVEELNEELQKLDDKELAQVTGAGSRISTEAPEDMIECSNTPEEATKLAEALVYQQQEQGMLASSNQVQANVLSLLK